MRSVHLSILIALAATACGQLIGVSGEDLDAPMRAPTVDDGGAADSGTGAAAAPDAAPACDGVSECVRVVFVTGSKWTGDTLGGVSGADAKCNQAAAASLHPAVQGRSFVAWISGSEKSAASRHVKGSKAYLLVDGTPVADDWTQLTSGYLRAPIALDENDEPVFGESVWTGTNEDGTAAEHCGDWASPEGFATTGATTTSLPARGGWTNLFASRRCKSSEGHLYCVER